MARRGSGGRPRKGQSRMDAALDAMKAYGFPEELIASTIGELLDVYGVDGWPFIEEASYKVLLDNILEKIEIHTKESDKDDSVQSDNEGDNTNKALAAGPSIPPVPTCSYKEVLPTEFGATVTEESASETNKVPEIAKSTDEFECKAHLSITDGEGSCLRLERKETRAFQTRNRGPYHGWVSDNDEPLDLVELIPAPLPFEFAELHTGTCISRNRKRRWDERPQDIKAL